MPARAIDLYQRAAPGYDRAHGRWLRHAGGEAQCAFEGAAAALMRPGMAVLDAACGTGHVMRRLLAGTDGAVDATVLDAASAMLACCTDLDAEQVGGRIEAMPFADARFDLVTCAWGLEACDAPEAALGEMLRVCRPGGHVCLCFCAAAPARGALAWTLARSIRVRGLGTFLQAGRVAAAARAHGAASVRMLHCTGPAAALLIRR